MEEGRTPERAAAIRPRPGSASGHQAYARGLHAEENVAFYYERQGWEVVARRWRGAAAEIDLIVERYGAFDSPGEVVFIEVKAGQSFDAAAARLDLLQIRRIMLAAGAWMAMNRPSALMTMRFDAALVDGTGDVEVIENISMGA